MKTRLICLLPSLFALTAGAATGKVGDNKTYPAFQAGVTGAWMRIDPGHEMFVERVDAGSPAEDHLKPGDRVLAANGRAIGGLDPRVPLGTAVTEAETGAGALTLSVMLDGGKLDAAVKVPVLGSYAENWPADCGKSEEIIKAHARHLARMQTEARRQATTTWRLAGVPDDRGPGVGGKSPTPGIPPLPGKEYLYH